MENYCLSYQKTSKNGFVLSLNVCTKTLCSFLVCLRWQSNSQVTCFNWSSRCCNRKKATLKRNKLRFRPKSSKNGFWGFSDIAPLKPSVIFLNCSDYAQTYKIASDLIAKGAQTIKMACLAAKITFWSKKLLKKRVFRGFQENSKKTFRKFTLSLKLGPN